MLVYFKNHMSKITQKRSNHFNCALAVGEYNTGDTHTIVVTPVTLEGGTSSGYGSGYKILDTFEDLPPAQVQDESTIKKEGLGSLEVIVSEGLQWIERTVSEDFSSYSDLVFWIRSTEASTALKIRISDSSGAWASWDFTTHTTQNEWKEIILDISQPDDTGGTLDLSDICKIRYQTLPEGTHFFDNLRGDTTQILSFDLDAANWIHPLANEGQYTIPSIAATDAGVTVAAWICKASEYTTLRICNQGITAIEWTEDWSTPEEIHTATDIDGLCCLPQHGEAGGIDIYFRAKDSQGETAIYRAWTNSQGIYQGTEAITSEYDEWTASILPDGTKVLIFQVVNPTNSKALKVLVNSGSGWSDFIYLTTYVKMSTEQGYQWVLFEDVQFEDESALKCFWMDLKGGGADSSGIIHLLSMSLKEHPQSGTSYVEDMYIQIDLNVSEARGEFFYKQMGLTHNPETDYDEGLSVEVLTGIPHIFFEMPGPSYDQIFHAVKQPGQTEWSTYELFWDGTREKIGASTRDDCGGCIAMVGNHWTYADNKLLRGSIRTISCASITPDKNAYSQSMADSQANFERIIVDSQGESVSVIDETFSTVILPSKDIAAFSNPFSFTEKMAVNYTLLWSPSIKVGEYLMWLCQGVCAFKYLLPDQHVHTITLDHNTLDNKTTKVTAEIHNQVHGYEEIDTDSVPGQFTCRFFFNNPDPDFNGYVNDPLPSGCVQIGDDIHIQGQQPGDITIISTNFRFDGLPRVESIFVAVDCESQINETQIYDLEGNPLPSEENNILGKDFELLGVINLNIGTDKMVYRKIDEKVIFEATTQDAFGNDIPECDLSGYIRLPYSQTFIILPPWTEISEGTYHTENYFSEENKAGFYAYNVIATKENYVPGEDTGTFLYGKMFGGRITVEPTSQMDMISKKDQVEIFEPFAGAKGPVTITSVKKSNLDPIELTIEETEDDLGEVIEDLLD